MNRTVISALCMIIGVASASAQTPSHLWSDLYGLTSDQYGQAIAADEAGNVIVAGTFWNAIDPGGGVLTSAGMTDVFLAKFDASGLHQWSRRFGDSGLQNATAVAIDASGHIALTGYFRGTVDFGGGGLTSAGSSDIFIAVYDATGAHRWSKRFGNLYSDQGRDVVFDPHGNITLVGSFISAVDFGGGSLDGEGSDGFAASFAASGAHRWSREFGDADAQEAWSIACDPSGRVAIGGRFRSGVDLGGGTLTSAGAADVFVTVLDSLGTHRWSTRAGDALDQYCHSVAMDVAGNAWATGSFLGAMNFGGGPLTSAGDRDVFVVKFDSLGVHQASARYGDAATQTAWDIATDAAGNVVLTGEFAGTIDLGGGALSSAGGSDIFVALLDGAASHRWSNRFGDTGNDAGYGVDAVTAGRFVLTGLARGTVNFGGGALVAAGGADAFVASFASLPTPVTPGPPGGIGLDAYPNPFNPMTTIRYTVPSKGRVAIEIYDARGGRVANLLDEERAAGSYSEKWDGRDSEGRAVSSGVYFARITHPQGVRSYKLTLLK